MRLAGGLLALTIIFTSDFIVMTETCLATSSARACSTDDLALSPGGSGVAIPVTSSGLTITQIGNTMDTISTMTVSCTAANGLVASMYFDPSGAPAENAAMPQTVAITVSCSSVDEIWNYVITLNGIHYEVPITGVRCNQAASG
ncbi:unnamed protein product [Caenorhabditis nigoni]